MKFNIDGECEPEAIYGSACETDWKLYDDSVLSSALRAVTPEIRTRSGNRLDDILDSMFRSRN